MTSSPSLIFHIQNVYSRRNWIEANMKWISGKRGFRIFKWSIWIGLCCSLAVIFTMGEDPAWMSRAICFASSLVFAALIIQNDSRSNEWIGNLASVFFYFANETDCAVIVVVSFALLQTHHGNRDCMCNSYRNVFQMLYFNNKKHCSNNWHNSKSGPTTI